MTSPIALCDFNKITGWRIRAVSQSKDKNITVVKFGSIKLLKIPVTRSIRAGSFCNPRKLLNI